MHRALITGVGHRDGIGYATASMLAERGEKVFTTWWGPFDESRDYEPIVERPWPSVEADLEDMTAPKAIFEAAESAVGTIDILILNHAYFQGDDLESVKPEVLDRHLAINVRASVMLCQEFVRRNMSGWGRIVFLTSGQSLHPMPDTLSYTASKGAVESVMLALAGGLAKAGITVNAVDPGGTDTGWMSEEFRTRLASESPRGRVGEPLDAARLVAFLASEEAGWITGQLIRSRGSALQ